MFIDSHCHIDFPELAERADELMANMASNKVSHALCVSVNLPHWPNVIALAERYPHIYASVGVHPDYEDEVEPTVAQLVELAQHPKVIAIGETGLDYYRLQGDLEWQRERFRVHIRAARQSGKPLIIHTRSAADDTLRLMAEEKADEIGGVLHCFTESQAVADAAIAMNFYISFSGIVTFKKAEELKAVAKTIPLERMLIETDSPYLAPMPFRGKQNQPAYVKHVAEHIADLRGIGVDDVARATTANFARLFKLEGRLS
ncbi:TatD family hydrolase [Chitinimonas sp. BJB300]|uniref:TatD family hydrolase n=1 Tax=Chitinimonas sp. BJB300 TaxID=1559339 RepID=UPI000C0E66E7|nr:TatD family hydrolase [Chitinimonas sp. BJB300]PHV11730.1 DNAase [Chitinimonas sp. BJB300]TSJ90007.1 TatD family deoxyribonuclease [Chitinimonas sp. BJB300]